MIKTKKHEQLLNREENNLQKKKIHTLNTLQVKSLPKQFANYKIVDVFRLANKYRQSG